MNRRGFFSKLSAAVAGIYIGLHYKLPSRENFNVEDYYIQCSKFESKVFTFLPSFVDFLHEQTSK